MKIKYPKKEYPREVRAFCQMHQRVKKGIAPSCYHLWSRTTKGFMLFLKDVGKIPEKMIKPSLGRKNHSKGYTPTNCKWQETYENIIEALRRPENQIFRTEGIRKNSYKISKANKGRKLTAAWKRKIGLGCKGKPAWNKGKHHTEEAKAKMSDFQKNRPPRKCKKPNAKTKKKMSISQRARRIRERRSKS